MQLTQQDIAKASGVAQTSISSLETKPAVITKKAQELRRVADSLNVSALEAYEQAGLFEFEQEEDRQAIEAALLIRELPPDERAALLDSLRSKGKG